MTDQQTIATRTDNWPNSYREILPRLRNAWHVNGEIYLTRRLSGGKSGALVYLADITTDSFEGLAILKLDSSGDPDKEQEHEAHLHAQAIENAPEFAEKHLPRVISSFVTDSQLAILSTIAGRRLEYAIPWKECAHDQQIKILETVSDELLSVWNADYSLDDTIRTPPDLLQRWLDYRLEPENGGGIHKFLAENCGVRADAPAFMCNGHWMPNPLYFAEGRAELPESSCLRGAMGHCHGDFHGLNLLIDSRSDNNNNYLMIDMAHYQSRQYLFFDHSYFELAMLLDLRGDCSGEEWEALVSHLCHFPHMDEPAHLRSDDIGLIHLVDALRQGIAGWIDRNESDRLAYMENQALLARVAAGLNFSHKNIAPSLKLMGFYYAAQNLKDYLKVNRISWERSGPDFSLALRGEQRDSGSDDPGKTTTIVGKAKQIETAPRAVAVPANADQSGETVHPSSALAPSSFLYELRRRNVIRVSGLYIVVSWLCIQVTIAVEAALKLPDWSSSLVAVLLGLGFFVVCAMTWAFELTNEGLKRTGAAPSGEKPDKAKIVIDYFVMIGIVAIIAITGREYIPLNFLNGNANVSEQQDGSPVSNTTVADAVRPSIAVLPFKGFGSDQSDEFGDGLTIEIITVLAQTGRFKIPGITSSFRFEDTTEDPRVIGEALNVDYLVEGVVRDKGETIQIEANMIRAEDGFLVWSNTYLSDKTDLFKTQGDIGNAIGVALSTPLEIDAEVLEAQRTENPEAYELFLKSLPLLVARGAPLLEALELLQRSVDLAPDFAAAWAALSLTYERVPNYLETVNGLTVQPNVYYRRAKQAALRAQEIDPTQAIVRHAVGNVFLRDLQWRAAEVQFASAVADTPSYGPVMLPYTALLYSVGKFSEAERIASQAYLMDPLNKFQKFNDIFINEYIKSVSGSLQKFEELFFESESLRPLLLRIFLDHYALAGNLDAVMDILDRCETCSENLRGQVRTLISDARELSPDAFFEKNLKYMFFGYGLAYSVGGTETALRLFKAEAVEAKSRMKLFTVPWKLIDKIGSDPQFAKIADEIGLVRYWNSMGWPAGCEKTGDGFTCS